LPACPGCPRFGALDPAPLAAKQLREFCERYSARHDFVVGARQGFRHRARLSVRGRIGRPKIGIFAEGSHRVVDIPACQIHHPLINEVARELKTAMRDLRISSYSDSAHLGLVRALQVVVQRSSASAQLVLICNEATPTAAAPLLERLTQRLGARLHSAFWNGNTDVTNRILGDTFHHVTGPEAVVEQIGGARVFFPPGAFGQNNLDLFERMVEAIHAAVPAGRHVVELYAGAGAIGLGLVSRSLGVVFNEISPASLAGLELGLNDLGQHRSRAVVVPGPAPRAAQAIQRDSIVIVDPPRKGLDPELLAALHQHPPERLLYVSCELSSLIRDAEVLRAGGLQLEQATGYDLFPFTDHLETLASFRRVTSETSRA
jgi:23S rRNA (uracil1939-C5)-methyltransferase